MGLRSTWFAWLAALVLAGCLRPSSTICADGSVCPAGTICDTVRQLCLLPEQLVACDGLADREPCQLPLEEGVCRDGICMKLGCGDGIVTAPEQCESPVDENRDDCTEHGFYAAGAVTCSRQCAYDFTACEGAGYCGDGVVNADEPCDRDDLGAFDCSSFGFQLGDGLACSAVCTIDIGGCRAPEPVLAVGSGGLILRWLGVDWGRLSSGGTANLYAVAGAGNATAFAVGEAGTILRWNGAVWTSQASPELVALNGVWAHGPNEAFAVGDSGTIVHWNGSAWTSMASGTTTRLFAVWGTAPDDVFVVGDGGAIRRFDGTTWSAMTSNTTSGLNAVWGTDRDNVFAVGNGGVIRRWNGTMWSAQTSGVGVNLQAIWGASAGDVFAVGNAGTILRFNGTGWSAAQGTVTSVPLLGVFGTGGSDVYAVGGGGTIFRFDGTDWTAMMSGTTNTLNSVWASTGP